MAHGRTKHNRTYKPIFVDITLGENPVEMALEEDFEAEEGSLVAPEGASKSGFPSTKGPTGSSSAGPSAKVFSQPFSIPSAPFFSYHFFFNPRERPDCQRQQTQ
jgi:hypothetical protein